MKNADLIAILKTLPLDLEVKTEGCDCYGEASGAELVKVDAWDFHSKTDYILIGRTEE